MVLLRSQAASEDAYHADVGVAASAQAPGELGADLHLVRVVHRGRLERLRAGWEGARTPSMLDEFEHEPEQPDSRLRPSFTCASVLATQNSIPWMSLLTMLFTALEPPPPTPNTCGSSWARASSSTRRPGEAIASCASSRSAAHLDHGLLAAADALVHGVR